MSIIGIACNPQSGKDIRRLLTAATTIDDMEKLNILERILLSAAAVGDQKVYLMPDRLGYGRLLLQKRQSPGYPGDLSQLEVYDMERTETQSDTIFFASEMERIGADVLIVMGGGGKGDAEGAHDLHVHRNQQRLSGVDGGDCGGDGRRRISGTHGSGGAVRGDGKMHRGVEERGTGGHRVD